MELRKEILQAIYDVLSSLNEQRDEEEQIPLEPGTPLFGQQGHLESLALVNFIVEMEEQIQDKFNETVVLTDDEAFSDEHFAFGTIDTLANYINDKIKEETHAG